MVIPFARHRGRWPAVIAVVLCVVLWPAAPAAAHNSFTGSDPADGARLAEPPERVRLSFLSRLDPATTKVSITGPDSATTAGGAPRFDGSRVTIPFTPGPAGEYTVAYQVASSDGHPIKGDIQFTLTTGEAPAGSPSPAATSAEPLPSSPASPLAESAAAAPLDRTAGEAGSSRWPWILAVALVLGALAGGGMILISRRRPG